jgi:hypothetical protein
MRLKSRSTYTTYICATSNLELRTYIFPLIHATSILEVCIHTFYSDPPKSSSTPILRVSCQGTVQIIRAQVQK